VAIQKKSLKNIGTPKGSYRVIQNPKLEMEHGWDHINIEYIIKLSPTFEMSHKLQWLKFSTIFARAEYVPKADDMTPTVIIILQSAAWKGRKKKEKRKKKE
jgi:hypothetical protein